AVRLSRELLTNMDQAAIPHPDSPLGAYVSLSIGIAVITPPLGVPLEIILDQADHALYEAKSNGRNRSVLFGMGEIVQPPSVL
ncbi:MAG: diguanylate cyclase domain-containing protein, partial [Flavobacteriales bacterium]